MENKPIRASFSCLCVSFPRHEDSCMILESHLINVIFAAILSVITNYIMIFIVCGSKRLTKAYKIQMYVTAGICLYYTAINVFVNPTIAVIPSDSTVIFVKGGIETNFQVGNVLLDIFVGLIMLTAILPSVQFVYRYLHIVHASKKYLWERGSTWLLVLIPLFFSISSSTYFCYEIEPEQIEIDRYNETTFYINILGYTSFLVASTKIMTSSDLGVAPTNEPNLTTLGAMFYMAIIIFLTNCLILFTAISIRRSLKKENVSPSTLAMHKQLNNTLTAQAIIPFITIHVPFYMSCLAPCVGWYIFIINEYLPYLFSYYSVFTPLSVIYYSKKIRRLFCCFNSKKLFMWAHSGSLENQPHWAEHRN